MIETTTTTTTTILWPCCLALPGWAGTRRNIHPLNPDHQPYFISFFHLLRYDPYNTPYHINMISSMFSLHASQSFRTTSGPVWAQGNPPTHSLPPFSTLSFTFEFFPVLLYLFSYFSFHQNTVGLETDWPSPFPGRRSEVTEAGFSFFVFIYDSCLPLL